MESGMVDKLADKSMTKDQIFKKVSQNPKLIPECISGLASSKPTIRYGCGTILMRLSEQKPDALYPYIDSFLALLDSKYRILTWNALCVIANLTRVDTEKIFEKNFERYYSLIDNDYLVTVTNVVGNSAKIALAKPHLTDPIVEKLLQVEHLSTTPHLSAECKRVIAEQTIQAFDLFFPQIEQKEKVLLFVSKHLKSSRKTLRKEAENFLKKWK